MTLLDKLKAERDDYLKRAVNHPCPETLRAHAQGIDKAISMINSTVVKLAEEQEQARIDAKRLDPDYYDGREDAFEEAIEKYLGAPNAD